MSGEYTQFDLMASALTQRRTWYSQLQQRRYNAWMLGLSASLSMAVWLGCVYLGYLQSAFWAVAAGVVMAPLPIVVVSLSWSAASVEWHRLASELAYFSDEPELPEMVAAPPAESEHLRPGMVVNGEVVRSTVALSGDKAWLRDACIRLIGAGQAKGSWTRSALAEGKGALMKGEEWDAASVELQRLNWFIVTGKGLAPMPNSDLAEMVKRLEQAV